VDIIRTSYYIHGPELMTLVFANVPRTMGLTRCYDNDGFFTFITDKRRNHISLNFKISSGEYLNSSIYEAVVYNKTRLRTVFSSRATSSGVQFAGGERFRWARDAVDERSIRRRCSVVGRCARLLQKHDVTRPVDGQIERRAQFVDALCSSKAPWRSREGPDHDRRETTRSTARPFQTSFKYVDHSQTGAVQYNTRRSPLDPPQIVDDRVDDYRRGNCSRFHVVELCESTTGRSPRRRRRRRWRRCPGQNDRDAVYVRNQTENETTNLRPTHCIGLYFPLLLWATLGFHSRRKHLRLQCRGHLLKNFWP